MEKFSSQNPEDNEREKMPPPSEEAAERIARQEEMARLNKPDGEKDPFARAKKYVRVLLAGAVLTFGGKLAHEKYEAHTEEKGATEYVLRSGLKERAEAAGFDLKIDVPNGDGPYIAHIGYIHSFNADTPSAQLLNELAHELILEGNKDAEKLLLSLKEKDALASVVFTETYDDESEGFLELVESTSQRIESVPLGKDTLQEVTAIISSLPEKETLTKDARTSFEYAISKKILNLYEKDPALDKEKYEQLKAACVQKLGSFDMPTVQDRMFKAGAALKTFVDGKYKIAPAESSEIRDQMNKEQAGLNPLTERLGTLAQQANAGSIEAGKEYDKVAREYNEKKNKYHVELELNARENYAVSLIKNAASDAAVDHGVIPMLYGTSHDFSDNVEKSNKSDQKKIGLISLIPKRYKGKRE